MATLLTQNTLTGEFTGLPIHSPSCVHPSPSSTNHSGYRPESPLSSARSFEKIIRLKIRISSLPPSLSFSLFLSLIKRSKDHRSKDSKNFNFSIPSSYFTKKYINIFFSESVLHFSLNIKAIIFTNNFLSISLKLLQTCPLPLFNFIQS